MRSSFLNIFSCVFLLGILAAGCQKKPDQNQNSGEPEGKYGFKLSVGSYSFKNFTFLESLPKIDSCGLKYTEGFPGQVLGGDLPGKLDYRMDSVTREKLLAILNEKGIQMAAYGVVTPKTEAGWDSLFHFATKMGVETISSEPSPDQLPYISSLCDRYQINVAIHNHPAPSRYWHPDSVMRVVEGMSKRIGVGADVGHWMRSGLDPVECLQKVNGRLLHFHLKDLDAIGNKDAHDVIWGDGAANMPGIIEEIKKQKFHHIVSAEYEHNWNNNTGDIAKCIDYFRSKL